MQSKKSKMSKVKSKASSKVKTKVKAKVKTKVKKPASAIKTKVKKIGELKLKMDFVSSNVLNEKDEKNRIKYILGVVKDGTILVTDGVMTPDEELNLIRETMRRVDNGFPGIEVCSLKREAKGYQKLVEGVFERTQRVQNAFSRMVRRSPVTKTLKYGITLIGPSRLIKEIKKNPDSFSVFAEA